MVRLIFLFVNFVLSCFDGSFSFYRQNFFFKKGSYSVKLRLNSVSVVFGGYYRSKRVYFLFMRVFGQLGLLEIKFIAVKIILILMRIDEREVFDLYCPNLFPIISLKLFLKRIWLEHQRRFVHNLSSKFTDFCWDLIRKRKVLDWLNYCYCVKKSDFETARSVKFQPTEIINYIYCVLKYFEWNNFYWLELYKSLSWILLKITFFE